MTATTPKDPRTTRRHRPATEDHIRYAPPRRRRLARVGRSARSVLFWMHLAVGVVTGVAVLAMSATGTLLAFQRQVLDWSAGRHVIAPAGAARLPLDTLVARGRAALPEGQQVSAVTVRRDPAAPVTLGLSARRYAYVDPYSGELLPASPGLQRFYFEVERWHRSMAMSEGLRGKPGVTITGAANLGFLFLILSGMILWLPRQFSWRALRAVLLFEPRVTGRRRDWNWHHVFGIWLAPVLVLLVLSGVFISYQWPTELLNRALGGEAAREEPARPGAAGEVRGEDALTDAPALGLDHIADRAAATVPDWYSIQVRMPREGASSVTATVSTTSSIRPDRRTSLRFDAASGEMKVEPGYAALPAARKLRSWVRGVHTGEAAGPAGQAVAAFASFAGVILVWTGIALAWRRMLRAVRT